MSYLQHFGLKTKPFQTTPDPAFAYLTKEQELAIAKIQYSVEERQGIFLLQGDVGAGKTTVSQFLLDEWDNNKSLAVAHITNPSVRTTSQFLRLILTPFVEGSLPRTQHDCWAVLRSVLMDNYMAKRNTVVIIDEAQTISGENMDTLTHIANEQTQKAKLVQLVLLAQPEFVTRKLVYKPALRDRIAHGSTLNPLSYEDATALIRFRVEKAGGRVENLFVDDLSRAIYNATGGVPRRLCMLCDNALLNAWAHRKKLADLVDVEMALQDLAFKGWTYNPGAEVDTAEVPKPAAKTPTKKRGAK